MKSVIQHVLVAMVSLLLPTAAFVHGGEQPGQDAASTQAVMQVIRATELNGREVRNQQGERLGSIEDVVIDTVSGGVVYAMMITGPLGRMLAVPWQALSVQPDERAVALHVSKERLQESPTFPEREWSETVEPEWLADLYSYYGFLHHPDSPHSEWKQLKVKTMRVARVTTLTGINARNPAREDLGTLRDLMIDIPAGHVAYILLGTGGLLGIGEEMRAVPWTTMRVEPVERAIVVTIDREKLRNAPAFDEDTWQETANRDWLAKVYHYYEARPYWEAAR